MKSMELWLQFKELLIDVVKYAFPTIALLLSLLSFIDSRKANKVQKRLNLVEEKLKKYELEEKEREREESTKACVEARVIKISKGNYKMKIWNSGKAIAYNVNFIIPEEYRGIVWKEKVPYEFLEPNKSFEECVLVHSGTPNKFLVTTTWEDNQGISYSKEQIVTI